MYGGHWGRLRRSGVLAASCLTALTLVAGCGSTKATSSASNTGTKPESSFFTGWPTSGKPVRGGTLTYVATEAPNTLDPFLASTGQTAIAQLYDELVELVPGSKSEAEVVPGLATSWSVSADRLTWTFHIREGVRFSNGEPVTAEDVAFSLQQSMLPTAPAKALVQAWTKVAVTGPTTIQIHLSKPQPILVETIDAGYFAIVPKAVYQREGANEFSRHPIGTGPFELVHASAGFAEVVEKRNPHYWRTGEPYLNEVVFKQIESDNARVLAARSGAADIAAQIPYSQASTLKSVAGVKMLIGPVWGASYNFFNRARAPFNETNVRRALMYATPMSEIVKSVYKGIGAQANSPWGRLKYWDPKVPYYSYNLTKARELLKHSSVPHGFNTTIEITGGETEAQLLASILQASWGQIGVHASIRSESSSTLAANFFADKYNFLIWPPQQGVSIYYQPDDAILFYFTTSEPGFGPKASAGFVAKGERAVSSSDESERAKLYPELQEQAYWQEALFMPVVNLVSLSLVSDSVRGFQVLPSTAVPMQQVWLQK